METAAEVAKMPWTKQNHPAILILFLILGLLLKKKIVCLVPAVELNAAIQYVMETAFTVAGCETEYEVSRQPLAVLIGSASNHSSHLF